MVRVGICLSGISYQSLVHASQQLPFIESVRRSFIDPRKFIGPAAAILPTVSLHNQIAVLDGNLEKCTERHLFVYESGKVVDVVGAEPIGVRKNRSRNVLSRCRNFARHANARFVESESEMWKAAIELVDQGKENVHLVFQDERFHQIPPELGDQGILDYAKDFLLEFDSFLQMLWEKQIPFGVTADHGMSVKIDSQNKFKVIDPQSELRSLGVELESFISPFPTTDYHRDIASSFCGLSIKKKENESDTNSKIEAAMKKLRNLAGVYSCIGAKDAERELELNSSIFGDIVLLGDQNTVFDYRQNRSGNSILRSHGSLDEQLVPFIICAPNPYSLSENYQRKLTSGKIRNYDLWDFLDNGIQSTK